MKSTPIGDVLEDESTTDEEEMERDISSISEDIRNSSPIYDNSGEQFQNEILSMRNQLEELKRQKNNETVSLPQTNATKKQIEEGESNIFEEVFRYKKTNDVIEIVSLITVYVIFTLNAFVELIDNMIPFMFYNYNPIIKGILFVVMYRSINYFLRKLLKGNQ